MSADLTLGRSLYRGCSIPHNYPTATPSDESVVVVVVIFLVVLALCVARVSSSSTSSFSSPLLTHSHVLSLSLSPSL